MLAILLLFCGVFSRLVLHAPNFTPVISLALFGGVYLKRRQALSIPLALMVLSDLIIGMHSIILFTWGSVLLIAALGIWLKRNKNPLNIFATSMLSAILFFIITNFGSWLVMYPHTLEGFMNCYMAAIPFFRHTLFSAVLFSFILFGIYEMIATLVKNTRFARILLAN